MNPEVRFNEDAGSYELGFEVDGVFIVLQTVQATYVASHVETVKAAQTEQQPAAPGQPVQQPQTF